VFVGDTAPENFTGEIKKCKPSHLVVIDAADMGKKPGYIAVIGEEKISHGISFCTHQLPITILTDYLKQEINCSSILIGIQPKKLDFNAQPTKPVKDAVKKLSAFLAKML
jgi:hydrogenase 3 maturation protease